jgi:hypothetical protein
MPLAATKKAATDLEGGSQPARADHPLLGEKKKTHSAARRTASPRAQLLIALREGGKAHSLQFIAAKG